MGAPAYYPLIEAGKNWYECKAGCELILDDITELVFVVGTFGEKHKKKVIMDCPDFLSVPIRLQDCLWPLHMCHRRNAALL